MRDTIEEICNEHLCGLIALFEPQWIVGVGGFAEKCASVCVNFLADQGAVQLPQVGKMLHPSPASPAANRDWESQASKQLRDQRIWSK
jgi:single-strand selective monofunctional uracil DNA glycosylase